MALIASSKERAFGLDEIFVAATDAAGRIRAADGVLVRLSGYEPGELLGRAYAELRHPEMPRRLAGELFGDVPAAAYVRAWPRRARPSGPWRRPRRSAAAT